MKLDVDGGKLLYGIGIALGIAALVYFVQDLVFGLSITVKAVLLFLAFVGFFVVGTATDRDLLDGVAIALAGAAYVVFLGYVVLRYSLGETGIFLALALSAALFVGLGYLLREREFRVPMRRAGYVVAAIVVVSVVLVGVDAAGGGVTYDVRTNETVTVAAPADDYPSDHTARVSTRIGTLTATNEFVFRRSMSLPDASGCVVDPDGVREESLYVDFRTIGGEYANPDSIGGGQSVSFVMRTTVSVDVNATGPVTYAVQRGTDCPSDVDEPTIVVSVDDAAHPD